MAINKIEFIFSQKGMDRAEIRKKVVEKFLEEKPGPGENDDPYNRYEYLVEKTKEGNILLTRPANLKLGFDFRIDVEGKKFMKGTISPAHQDIFLDLKEKYAKDPKYAEEIRRAIIRVYNMDEPEDIISSISEKNIGFSVELILKLAKWFAIEQDVRYWNGKGRILNITWLELIKYFNYNFKIIKKNKVQAFVFYDCEGNEVFEKKATKLMNNSEQEFH